MDCSPTGWLSPWDFPGKNTISFSRGSSWAKDWTCISCSGRRTLYLWAIREAYLRILRIKCSRIFIKHLIHSRCSIYWFPVILTHPKRAVPLLTNSFSPLGLSFLHCTIKALYSICKTSFSSNVLGVHVTFLLSFAVKGDRLVYYREYSLGVWTWQVTSSSWILGSSE